MSWKDIELRGTERQFYSFKHKMLAYFWLLVMGVVVLVGISFTIGLLVGVYFG